MIKILMIGTLGADCEKKSVDGSKFTTFRVAHNEVWTDAAGQEHSNTIWIDAILADHPKVADYLKRGTQVFLEGYPSLRVYSSPKDRCMKAGMNIRVQRIELIGGKVDPIPRELIDTNGCIHKVNKFYNVEGVKQTCQMIDRHGNFYNVDNNGWVKQDTTASQQTDSTKVGNQSADNQQSASINDNKEDNDDGAPF